MDSEKQDKLRPLLEAIAWVATSWAKLEHAVNEAIWKLACMDDADGACITSQIPTISGRFRALIALVERNHGTEETLKKLKKFAVKVEGLGRQRNRIIHDPWMIDQTDESFGRLEVTADKKLVFEVRPQTPAEVLAIADAIREATEEFVKLRGEMANEFAALVKAMAERHAPGSGAAIDEAIRKARVEKYGDRALDL